MKHQIQFAHANGFPAPCFNTVFEAIEHAEIHYVERMGHNQFPLDGNLENLALELIASIEQRFNQPIIGIGHSTGGVLLLIAASIKPQLFKNLILIEPILYHPWKRKLIWLMKNMGLSNYIGPAKRTLKRRSVFQSREVAKAYFESKPLFQAFHKNCFIDYLQHGLKQTDKGYELTFSKAIEAEIYRSTYTKLPPGLEKLKATLIYGKHSKMFGKMDANWWKKTFPNFDVITVDAGHLFPLEQPIRTASLINSILK